MFSSGRRSFVQRLLEVGVRMRTQVDDVVTRRVAARGQQGAVLTEHELPGAVALMQDGETGRDGLTQEHPPRGRQHRAEARRPDRPCTA